MKRLLTSLVLIPTFLYVVIGAPRPVFLAVLALNACLCLYEFLGIAERHPGGLPGFQRNPIPYAAGLIALFAPSFDIAILLGLLLMAWSLRAKDLVHSLSVSAFFLIGIVYVFGAWRAGAALHQISPWWMLFALAVNWVGDTFAFYGGRAFGRHKLAPRISPGKSWEGTICSLLATAILGTLYLRWRFPEIPIGAAVALSLAANFAGQIGDLVESAFKRGAGVKDSGTLLPGHGGWLDRVDSSLFSVPVVWWLLQHPWMALP